MIAPVKDPEEIITLTFPFGDELGDAAIIAIDYVIATVVTGADAAVATMHNGAAVISGGDALQSVRYGVDGVFYKFRCRASLSDGRKLVRTIYLHVRTA